MTVVSQPITFQNAATGTGNGNVFKAEGYASITFDVAISATATVTFEICPLADTTYTSLSAVNLATLAIGTTATASGTYSAPISGAVRVRARVSSFGSGTITVIGIATEHPSTLVAVAADTELPAAAALADATANPTTTSVGVFNHLIGTGGTWNRQRDASNTGSTGAGVAQVAAFVWTGSAYGAAHSGASVADSGNGQTAPAMIPTLYNSSVYERQRNNYEATVYASAARTASPSASDLTNHNARGVVVTIDCTAVTDTPSVVFTIQGKSTLGTDYYNILASAAVVGTGVTTLKVYPGITAAANASVSDVLPRVWRVDATHADGDSITYSVSANYVV